MITPLTVPAVQSFHTAGDPKPFIHAVTRTMFGDSSTLGETP
jgi:hypothetical protein